jgi:hypothetical protein
MARARVARGESYVAGAAALNTLTGAPRISRDVDVFHDTAAAVEASWVADRALLTDGGFEVVPIRERSGYVEAVVRQGNDSVLLQWTSDSAFRFFPLVEHEDFGLTLHLFDHATNKVLALVGRLEVRDWVDVIHCAERIQPLGYLVWAASGKDPGFSPASILAEAGRTARYAPGEIDTLVFAGETPDPGDLSRRWHAILEEARRIVALLPPNESGKCVLDAKGELAGGDSISLDGALTGGSIRFHEGRIQGAWPVIR